MFGNIKRWEIGPADQTNACPQFLAMARYLSFFFQCTAGLILGYIMRFLFVLFGFEREWIFQIWSSIEIKWNYNEKCQLSAALHSVLKTKPISSKTLLNKLTSHALVFFLSLSLHVKAKFCDCYLLDQLITDHIYYYIYIHTYICADIKYINTQILVCVYKKKMRGWVIFIFCKKCLKLYVGGAITFLRERFNNHKSNVKRYQVERESGLWMSI